MNKAVVRVTCGMNRHGVTPGEGYRTESTLSESEILVPQSSDSKDAAGKIHAALLRQVAQTAWFRTQFQRTSILHRNLVLDPDRTRIQNIRP